MRGPEALEQRKAKMPANRTVRLTEAEKWQVLFYDATRQTAKAHAWRTRLKKARSAAKPSTMS